MSKGILIAVVSGLASASAWLVLPLTGSPAGILLIYVAVLPLLLAGLSLGIGPGTIATIVGIAFTALVGGLPTATVYTGACALPASLIGRLALTKVSGRTGTAPTWLPAGSIVSWLSAATAALVVVAAWSIAGADGIEQSVRSVLEQVATALVPVLDSTFSGATPAMIADTMTPFFIGFSAVNWLLAIIGNGIVAQSIVSRRGQALRPTPRWSALTLPNWLPWLLVASGVLALSADGDVAYLARNVIVILTVPYFLLGVAVVHVLARRVALKTLILVIFYMLMLMSPLLAVVVAALGMGEQWVGLRRRVSGGAPDDEE